MELFRSVVTTILELVWFIITYSYIAWWSISRPLVRLFTRTGRLVLLGASIVFFLEVVFSFFSDKVLAIHLPLWGQFFIIALAGWALYHRHREWKHSQLESIFAVAVAQVIQEIATLDLVTEPEPEKRGRLRDFIRKVFIAFTAVFESPVKMNVMLVNEDGKLQIHHQWPIDAQYDELALAPAEGCAGQAYERGITVYIPAIRYRHGITVGREEGHRTFDLEKFAYKPTSGTENFKSVLSVPLPSAGAGVRHGVLNIDSSRQNAFDLFDFDAASVAASMIAMALDRYRAV